jgi:lipid-A-disaccharide synthase
MQQQVVTELVQAQFNTERLTVELRAILLEGEKRWQLLSDYAILQKEFGGAGSSQRVAQRMVRILKLNTIKR